ncbi:MAG: transcription-repair coupling factor, partial [Rikenellaceae bacterium]
PNLGSSIAEQRVSLIEYIGEGATMWLSGGNNTLSKIDSLRAKLLKSMDDPRTIDDWVTSVSSLILQLDSWRLITAFGTLAQRKVDARINMQSQPQPSFGKNFKLLVDTVRAEAINGRETYILSENLAQQERLEDIFASTQGEVRSNVGFRGVSLTLHGGFSIGGFNLLTDHQIFERYHKYKIHNEIEKSVGMTISELNTLHVGDFVVHIDHGVGRFGGLVRQNDNGVQREYLKLSYRDGDVLMVGVHNLHRISKFKSSEAEVAPKIHKLGGGVWAKAKAVAKSRVKEMAKELIALYAKRKASQGFAFSADSYLQQELEASFIYEDTPDQLSTTRAIKVDMEAPQPMDRLVCGDVGFGKTEIAIRAAFKAATDGKQVAVLVPTTVLSLQHYRSFSRRLRHFPVRVENLSRAKSTKQTNEILKELKEGKIDIVVGTHKLLGKSVQFKDLGLLIVDEEQKFGVAGKEKLRQFKNNIDTLTLTATPIPRTLQFSLMGARDMSIIATPPPNRQPVQTEVHQFNDDILREAIEFEVNRGGQLFVLHNRVQTINQVAAKIRGMLPNLRVAVGHGQMPPKELEKVMMEFIYGEYDVFVATTIIESGIDIPNANTIIINNAHQFGLSDLHQLRGRVGRTNKKAYCYLFVPSLDGLTGDSQRRLRAIEEFSELGSGFNIAMQDLDIRGAGNILGGEQSGFVSDIGYDTYQKIINEAVNELRAEQGMEVEQQTIDTVIESDSAAYLPDEYVASTNEKIRLYRELDGLTTEDQLTAFIERLTDRFGTPPSVAQELFEAVRLRAVAQSIAIERLVIKNSKATLYFTSDSNHSFYQSPEFTTLLKGVSISGSKARINQKGDRIVLSLVGIDTFEQLRSQLLKYLGR